MRPLLQYVARPGILDLGWGHPIAAALPTTQWALATTQMLDTYGWQALTYGYANGPGPLVDWLTNYLSDVDARGGTAAETFVTAGASHGLELVTGALTTPGDVVLVQSPTYHLALRILADRGVRLVVAPSDMDGVEPAATGELVERLRQQGERIRLLYLVPTFANPTGHTVGEGRRRALVELAGRLGLTIVEDDTYRELGLDTAAPRSLWSLAGSDEVVRVGSFAKTVAPGLRLGWLNAAPGLIARLADLGYVDSGGGVNHATALTMAVFATSGHYDALVRSNRARYTEQRDALVDTLRTGLTVSTPDGGWFVWLALPAGVSARALLPVAEAAGVSFVDGSRFCVDGSGDDHVRLAYSMLPPDDLREAGRRLLNVLAHR